MIAIFVVVVCLLGAYEYGYHTASHTFLFQEFDKDPLVAHGGSNFDGYTVRKDDLIVEKHNVSSRMRPNLWFIIIRIFNSKLSLVTF